MATILLALFLGLLIGIAFKGININITHKHEQPDKKPKEYNQSLIDMIPNDVKSYYDKTQGLNKY